MGFSARLNALSTPFIADDGTGEDDYALLPPPRQLGTLQLMAITFFAVSGSAYGIEESVSAGGPLLALVALVVAAVCWSAPMAMVSSELSVAMPHSGGYIVWVHNAFGPMASLLNGSANLLCNVFDCALYPLLLSQYVERALLPMVPSEPRGGIGASWWNIAPDLIGSVLRMLLIVFAAAVNIFGSGIVGLGTTLLMLLVSVPIVALVLAAYSSAASEPLMPFEPALQQPPHTRGQWYFFVALVLWNTCGYDSAGMVAAEVAEARTTYPRALGGALSLITLSYLLPLAACASAVPPDSWHEWGEGQFELLGRRFGGPALEYALLAASMTSALGILCTLVLTTSRAIVAMAQLRMLPAAFARLHPMTGTPYLAILLNAALISVATLALRFEALVELSMLFYAINAIVQCAALLRLRRTHPHRLRPSCTLPAPLLCLPIGCALLLLALAPPNAWLGALSLIAATLIAYALIHLGRLNHGRKPSDPPSARATAAVEALAIVVPPFEGGHDGGADVRAGDGLAGEPPSSHNGRGDTWFRMLLPTYRRVPDCELARAGPEVAAVEMAAVEASRWARDVGGDEPDSPTLTSGGAASAAPSRGAPAAEDTPAPPRPASSVNPALRSRREASTDDAPPAVEAGVAVSQGGAVEVSESEAASMLAAEIETLGTRPNGYFATSQHEDFVDIIE